MSDTSPTDITRLEQAAEWLVLLSDDDPQESAKAKIAYEGWKEKDAGNAEAAAQIEGFIAQVTITSSAISHDPQAARAALDASFALSQRRQTRRRTTGIVAAFLLFFVCSWATLQVWPPSYLLADLRTATGEWRSYTLNDGTKITLNSRSAVNMHYDASRRTLVLVQGEILVDVARDASRPFIVETEQASIQALGTRFVVRQEEGVTTLSMLQSRVVVQTAEQRAANTQSNGAYAPNQIEGVLVEAGQRVLITENTISAPQTFEPSDVSIGWEHRQLIVNDQALPDVLDELARQHKGYIYFQRSELQHIKVSAVLPQQDVTKALNLLQEKFPELSIDTVTPMLVRVGLHTE